MTLRTTGIHHITAIARNPQDNVDFYSGILGLRLVKKTVNFDAPEVYHFYFGNGDGSPGTIMTFFPWPNARRGKVGGGQVGITTFAVPVGTLDFWEDRLHSFGITTKRMMRFKETYLQFDDNEGLRLELVEREEGKGGSWPFGEITEEKAIKGFGGAVLFSRDPQQTMHVLQHVMGLDMVAEEGGYARFRATGEIGNVIDLSLAKAERGDGGAGTVHHIAWRAQDFHEHEKWRQNVEENGFQATQIADRKYFRSIYFRERGGILFEIATDPPGFAVDEEQHALGGKLMLPDWLEPYRAQIESNLEPVQVRGLGANKR